LVFGARPIFLLFLPQANTDRQKTSYNPSISADVKPVYFEIKSGGSPPRTLWTTGTGKFEVKEIVQTFRGFRGIPDDTVVVLLKAAKDDSFIWQRYEEVVEKCEKIASEISVDNLADALLYKSGIIRL